MVLRQSRARSDYVTADSDAGADYYMQSALHCLSYADAETDRYSAASANATAYTAANGDSHSHTKAGNDGPD